MGYLLKIDGIDGESSTPPYLRWIALQSFNLERTDSVWTGEVRRETVHFATKDDSSYHNLMHALYSSGGKAGRAAKIVGTEGISLQITLTECLMGVPLRIAEGGGKAHVQFSLHCKKVDFQLGHRGALNKLRRIF